MLGLLVVLSFVFCSLMLALRLRSLLALPSKGELAPARSDPRSGIAYAFTLGMAPWAKESTRRHWVAYVRGILFHVGIFSSFFTLAVSPWMGALGIFRPALALVVLVGFLGGLGGFYLRFFGKEKALSTPDDYASLALVTLFQLGALGFALDDSWRTLFYVVTITMFLYIPFSKIRHFLYFFFSRLFFGAKYGRRGIVGIHR